MLLMIAVASVRLNVVHLFSVFYCSSASAPMSQGVGMTNLPLGGNKLKVVIFFYNTEKYEELQDSSRSTEPLQPIC